MIFLSNHKIKSNHGAATSVNILIWIALATIIVLALAAWLLPTIVGIGEEVAECIGGFQVGFDGSLTDNPCLLLDFMND
ncbi:MAG: hypothetical protein LBD23_16170 [Oscillospiraceae bacterium]|jgi:hypothetical protein|nr:hypothetical protein [Oscillospiraceae bacterium]